LLYLAAVRRWMTWLYRLSRISTSFHLFFSSIRSHSGLTNTEYCKESIGPFFYLKGVRDEDWLTLT
jgi:hypothetical protein